MIIALTGTPGTGKTSVAKALAKSMKAEVISIKKEAKHIPHTYDKKRKALEISIKLLQKAINKKMESSKKTIIIEGHMAHFLKADMIIILRTDPAVLEKRLKERRWSREKIRENIESEILDVITVESLAKPSHLTEVDTSKASPKRCAEIIMRIVKSPKHNAKYMPGKIDWSERYKKLLLE